MIQSIHHPELTSILNTDSGQNAYKKWKRKAIQEVSQNGMRLKDLSECWQSDRDVVAAAVKQNPLAIRYAPIFRRDKEMALLAVRLNGLARFWLSHELKKDRDVTKLAKKNFPKEHKPIPGKVAFDKRIFLITQRRCPPLKNLTTVNNEIFSLKLEKRKCSSFLRDSHVTLFEGGHLIPYSIKNPLVQGLLRAMIPNSANHFLIKGVKGENIPLVGKGDFKCHVEQAMITAYDFNIPFKCGNTCIEGGNCYLFMSKNVRKAVVGELSLYLSMIALEEQGFFKEILAENEAEPSLDAYRMARNLALSDNKEKLQNCEGELSYRKLLMASVSEEDRKQFLNEAKLIEAKLKLTKARMAEELIVSLENIAFVPQMKFHIDMEMFVTPQGEVILHDDQTAIEFLEEIQKVNNFNTEEKYLFEEYWNTLKENSHVSKPIQERRIEILQKLGMDFRLLPSVLESTHFQSALNYCNGIFTKNEGSVMANMSDRTILPVVLRKKSFTYITTGPSFKAEGIFHRHFLDIFEKSFPDLTFQEIPDMSNFVAKYDGGIHCLTFESSLLIEKEDP